MFILGKSAAPFFCNGDGILLDVEVTCQGDKSELMQLHSPI